MKRSKKAVRLLSVALAAVLGCGTFAALAGCTSSSNDTLIVMTQDLNGLYNPFYSTAGTDMDVVGQTQISMFSTDDAGDIAYGDDEAVVVKDFMQETSGSGANAESVYTFVIKNGLLFSDGEPLTMNDVFFNMYVLLDPAYTGSTTMYSTDIVGLQQYRTQSVTSDENNEQDALLNQMANNMAVARRSELITAYSNVNRQLNGAAATNYDVTEKQMRDYLAEYTPSPQYKRTISVNGSIGDAEAREQLIADYDRTLKLFKEELNNDFNSASSSYQSAPYMNVDTDGDGKVETTNESDIDFSNPVVAFMYMEGFIKLAYARDPQTNVEDKNHIVQENSQREKCEKNYNVDVVELKDAKAAREAAINYVYNSKVSSELHYILTYWATGGTLLTEFVGKAKDVVLHQTVGDAGLKVKNISGITSLGHSTQEQEVTINHEDGSSKTYKIAHDHNDDGTPAHEEEYDVLRIRVKGIDPKAIWNFGFTVAPWHYYSDPAKYPVNITENQFGVEWGSFDFMKDVIQGTASKEFGGVNKNMIPLGAGPYVATNRNNDDHPGDAEFFSDNIVYYKANENFLFDVKTPKMRYVVISSNNALDRLESGDVHFVEPQFTLANSKRVQSMEKKGFSSVNSWQLGYGYIGINAGKIPDLNLRKAIMSAMQTDLALSYYVTGEATTISWPMSLVSWAYPRTANSSGYVASNPLANKEDNNGRDYTMFRNDDEAKKRIRQYMGNIQSGDSRLTVKFTIAGSNLTDHPCYQVFKHAMDLLNECGWNVTVEPDLNALTKLATGSLTVWAAAWGSTIDPDMYQVYHKNSTATSVYAWGYREILADPARVENTTLNELAVLIDAAREIDSSTEAGKTARADIYKNAMGKVLDLAVELPVYQRKTLYVFNTKKIDLKTLTVTVNPDGSLAGNSYESPLSRIWEVELVK